MDCDTKYPIMLIHGTGFRDGKYINYWGRIPAELKKRGAVIFYGHQDSWGSIEHNAEVLKTNLRKFLSETNYEKVNIIAHSKGGLEARYMISSLGMAENVASLTTIATPHHGSETLDLLWKLSKPLFKFVAIFANLFYRILGDAKPDFFTTCNQFTTIHMKSFNERNPDAPNIYYQSYAGIMKNPFSCIIMFLPNFFVSLIEGENDGLVTPKSAEWTNFKGIIRGTTYRGISHPDLRDIRRINFAKNSIKNSQTGISDIRTFYVTIVAELKNLGL